MPFISIIIPHIGSSDILFSCLESIERSTYSEYELIIVDNGSDFYEGLLDKYSFPSQYIQNHKNLGFAGGCNVGIRAAKGQYVVFLNNDTQVDPTWLEPLIELVESDQMIAACQPLLLSSRFEGKMDYAGGLGGLIDIFGYPFAIGRIFDTTEVYDDHFTGEYTIFWASGTASIWRRSIFSEVGYFDEDFFAHMEEIDLNWRCHLSGYTILSTSKAKVFHYSGYSLGHASWKKMYLNHRNNLMMMLKNYELKTLIWIYPIRLLFEFFTVGFGLLTLKWKRSLAVIIAQCYLLFHIRSIWLKRKKVQKKRVIADRKLFQRMFYGSIVWRYFILRRKTIRQMMELRSLSRG